MPRPTTAINITRLTIHIEDKDATENKALAQIEAEEIYTKEEAKDKARDSDRRNAIYVKKSDASQLSTLLKSDKRHMKSSANMLYI